MALTIRKAVDVRDDRAQGIDGDPRIAAGPGFWQRARTLRMAQRKIDVGHVGCGSFHGTGDADAEHAAIAPSGFLLGAQRVVTDLPQRERKGGPVVAAVEQ